MNKTPKFTIIPDESELAQQERDLRFHPASVDAPKSLSPEQVEQFNRDGYLRPFPLLDATEVTATRDYFDALLEKHLAAGGDSYSISSAHLTYGRVYDLLTEPKIVNIARDLLGENVVGRGSYFFCKMPGTSKLSPSSATVSLPGEIAQRVVILKSPRYPLEDFSASDH